MLGFVKGQYVPSLRLKVTSKKLMTCLFASIVILSPFEVKTWHFFFLKISLSLGEALEMARPSSR